MISPKLSVLLPVRNGEATLHRALESLWAQSFSDFEVVVVNDGSGDGTLRLLEACADKRLRIFNQPPLGIATALNEGLKRCKAPLVVRMDADDEAHPERLARQYTYMQEHPETDVLSCRVSFGGNKVLSKGYALYVEETNQLLSHEQMYVRRFWDAPLAHPSVLFRKEVVQAAGGYSLGPIPEDYELWLRLFEKGCRFAKLPEILLYWNDSPLRLSRTHPHYHKKTFWRLKAHYFSRWFRKVHAGRRPLLYLWGETKKKSRSRYLLEEGLSIAGRIGKDEESGEGILSRNDLLSPEEAVVLVYVSNRSGKRQIMDFLESRGFKEGSGYFLMV